MNTNIDFVAQFKQFAEERLNNHFLELSTTYENLRPETAELKAKAFHEHKAIFEKETGEKIDSFNISDNPWLYNELRDIQRSYADRFMTHENE